MPVTEDHFPEALEIILREEGGYSNNRHDAGGATNYGVTQATWSNWLGHPATDDDIRSLTAAKVAPLYEGRYWRAASCNKLPAGADLFVFDASVQHGVSRALRWLQAAAGVTIDGKIGPATLAAVVKTPGLLDGMSNMRRHFYQNLPTFNVFGHGWLARLDRITTTAHEWAQETS